MPSDRRNANFARKQILVDGRLFIPGGCRSAHRLQLYVIEERGQGVASCLQPANGAGHDISGALRRGRKVVDDEGDGSPGQNLLQHGDHLPTKRFDIPTAAEHSITQRLLNTNGLLVEVTLTAHGLRTTHPRRFSLEKPLLFFLRRAHGHGTRRSSAPNPTR